MAVIASSIGTILVLAGFVDLFLAILYARSGTGLLSPHMARVVWHFFQAASRISKRRKDFVLSFCGPTLMLLLIGMWIGLFVVGFALMVWPKLGSSIQATSGPTPTGFLTALYYSGYNFTTLGIGTYKPYGGLFEALSVIESALGFFFFTLVVTYFLSVYGALRRRNTFALILHHKTLGTTDAAVFLKLLGSDGRFEGAQAQISDIAEKTSDLLESHHLYPILHFFRLKELQYAVPRIVLIIMDTVSLLKTLPDKEKHHEVTRSAPVSELWNGGMDLLPFLAESFISGSLPLKEVSPSEEEAWRQRYLSAAAMLTESGIQVNADRESGAQQYVSLRRKWNPYVETFLRALLYTRRDIFVPYNRGDLEE